MSIVHANNKVQRVESLLLENATIDDDAVSDLVDRHLKDFRSLQSTEVSPLFGRPIVLINCTIGAEHLEALQTLPKLRMLRLEDCIISGGAKFSESYAHIGKQKDSAPIMSKVEKEQEEIPAALRPQKEESLYKKEMHPRQLLDPKKLIYWVNFADLQDFVWEYLKYNRKMEGYNPKNTASGALIAVLDHFIEAGRAIPLEFTSEDVREACSIIIRYTNHIPRRGFVPTAVQFRETSGRFNPSTFGELMKFRNELASDYLLRIKIWEGFK